MKHDLSLTNVTIPRPNVASLELTLNLWGDSDPTTNPAVDTHVFNKETKTKANSLTTEQLLDRIQPALTEEVQAYINDYNLAELIEVKPAVLAMVSDIDGTLTS